MRVRRPRIAPSTQGVPGTGTVYWRVDGAPGMRMRMRGARTACAPDSNSTYSHTCRRTLDPEPRTRARTLNEHASDYQPNAVYQLFDGTGTEGRAAVMRRCMPAFRLLASCHWRWRWLWTCEGTRDTAVRRPDHKDLWTELISRRSRAPRRATTHWSYVTSARLRKIRTQERSRVGHPQPTTNHRPLHAATRGLRIPGPALQDV
ncbi:hypothetical protein C8Q80DRAFT_108513 [Daedaleopsis nitida]|nr:hypothetical protein C8Q80DRAFT_108513 [Daedaleopsis nitida]